jgi:hypothetical protein
MNFGALIIGDEILSGKRRDAHFKEARARLMRVSALLQRWRAEAAEQFKAIHLVQCLTNTLTF